MRLVIFTAIRIRRHERAVFELNRRAEAAALRLADWRACVEHQAIVGEVELEAVSGFRAENRADTQWRLKIADGEREQQPLVLEPQQRHIHLAVVAEVADAIERHITTGSLARADALQDGDGESTRVKHSRSRTLRGILDSVRWCRSSKRGA